MKTKDKTGLRKFGLAGSREVRACLWLGRCLGALTVALSSVQAQLVGFSNSTDTTSVLECCDDYVTISGSGASASIDLLNSAGSYTGGAVFANTQQNISGFAASYQFTATDTSPTLAGFAFVLQNDPRGAAAVGRQNEGYGYGGVGYQNNPAIAPSVAVGFNLVAGTYGIDTAGNPVNFNQSASFGLLSGDPIQVNLAYNGTALAETVTDTLHPTQTFSYSQNINLTTFLGASTAYIGFTGGGPDIASVIVTNFAYTPSVPEPSDLGYLLLGGMVFGLAHFRRRLRSLFV